MPSLCPYPEMCGAMRRMDRMSKIELSAECALIAVLLYCFWSPELTAAFVLSALTHELGHICAILLTGGRISAVRAELRGLCISYSTGGGNLQNTVIAAAGPLAGFIGAVLFSIAGERLNWHFMDLAAGVGLLLTVFNLLPVLPLDGGMIMKYALMSLLGCERGAALCSKISAVGAGVILALGMFMTAKGGGIALLVAAIWLLLSQDEENYCKIA